MYNHDPSTGTSLKDIMARQNIEKDDFDQTCSSSSVEGGMPHCFAARKLLCSIEA